MAKRDRSTKPLRFLVTGALLVGPAMGCEDEPVRINEPAPEVEPTNNEPVEEEPIEEPLPIDPVTNEYLEPVPVEPGSEETPVEGTDPTAGIDDALGDVRTNEAREP